MNRTRSAPRGGARGVRALLTVAALALTAVAPGRAVAQGTVSGGDFDICDNCGTLRSNTAYLTGRSGFGSTVGIFVLVNAATSDQDVDHDGYTPGVNFTDLVISDTANFVNIANPALAIPKRNFVLQGFINPLNNGYQRNVPFLVNIPQGTPAGRYRGSIQITSAGGVGLNPNGQTLRQDLFYVEIEVLPDQSIGLVRGDTAATLDSLVLAGRAGQRVSGVVRLANLGNAPLSEARVTVSDLRSESAVGLVIRSSNVTVSTPTFSNIAVGDTARTTITVQIPRGILGGRYRGTLLVQAQNAAPREVPLVLIVTSNRGILFENNPLRGTENSVARIAFNGDPGTQWRLVIFDMMGLTVYDTQGTVFAGVPGPGGTTTGEDYAVNVVWPLNNGRGQPVASGMYLVVVESIVNGQRQQARDRLMVIR